MVRLAWVDAVLPAPSTALVMVVDLLVEPVSCCPSGGTDTILSVWGRRDAVSEPEATRIVFINTRLLVSIHSSVSRELECWHNHDTHAS